MEDINLDVSAVHETRAHRVSRLIQIDWKARRVVKKFPPRLREFSIAVTLARGEERPAGAKIRLTIRFICCSAGERFVRARARAARFQRPTPERADFSWRRYLIDARVRAPPERRPSVVPRDARKSRLMPAVSLF